MKFKCQPRMFLPNDSQYIRQEVRGGEAGKIGSFIFLVPLIAIVISVLFLGETITTKMGVGLILTQYGRIRSETAPVSRIVFAAITCDQMF
ncbi:EamA family transporter [Paenibacillus sp. CR_12]|uniref:EamA family transporter n=1 Tax=Paenibacillus sp. CR_12 TaxID=3055793 RepID=UPI0035C16B5A